MRRAKESAGDHLRVAPKVPPKGRSPKRAAAAPAKRTSKSAVSAVKPASPRSTRKPPPARGERERRPTAADMLERAMAARTSRSRGIWARRGLAIGGRIDRTIQSMLLRQLYLAYYEERRFERAFEAAEQAIALDVLPDVAHQDAARAKQALGDVETAAGHLRLAARVCPAKRKAFHWWTLGSLYFLAHRYDEAISAMTRAARWGTTDKPLYQGHLAIIRCASGEEVPEIPALRERLAEVPAGQGYGRFVLGQLAFYEGRHDDARRYLEAFVKRSSTGRTALAIALEGEILAAREILASLAART